jgi:energy-coupling factor transporter ATP-binding protein EcfA2
MLKLRRLRIEQFRSVARNTELLFSDGINVLLGQNGTGKTTLLELISMVVRSNFSTLAKEEFAFEYDLSASEGESVAVVIRNDRVPVELQEPVDLRAREVFRPTVEVLQRGDRRRLIRYDPDHGLAIEGTTPIGTAGIPSPLDPGFLVFYGARVFTALLQGLLQAGNVHRFDESLDLFRQITSGGKGDVLLSIPGAETRWLPNPFAPPLVPKSIVEALRRSYKASRADYAFALDELGLLASLKDLMGFSRSDLRLDVTEQQGGAPSMQISNVVFRFWWEDGTLITHERLSYGQKRLVAFFYYLDCNSDVVIADELVNGLHHRWITASIDAIGQRQAFLTSQNPLLLDYVPITSAEAVRRSFVLCRSEPGAGRPGWIWENMSEEDAQDLFSAYGVGIEHVSEILQSRGLW